MEIVTSKSGNRPASRTFQLLCCGGRPPARRQRRDAPGLGIAPSGELHPRPERAPAAGEPSASWPEWILGRGSGHHGRTPRPNTPEKAPSGTARRWLWQARRSARSFRQRRSLELPSKLALLAMKNFGFGKAQVFASSGRIMTLEDPACGFFIRMDPQHNPECHNPGLWLARIMAL